MSQNLCLNSGKEQVTRYVDRKRLLESKLEMKNIQQKPLNALWDKDKLIPITD